MHVNSIPVTRITWWLEVKQKFEYIMVNVILLNILRKNYYTYHFVHGLSFDIQCGLPGYQPNMKQNNQFLILTMATFLFCKYLIVGFKKGQEILIKKSSNITISSWSPANFENS